MKKSSRNLAISKTNAECFWDRTHAARVYLEKAILGSCKVLPSIIPLLGQALGFVNPYAIYCAENIRRERFRSVQWPHDDTGVSESWVHVYDGLLFSSVELHQLLGEMKRFKRSHIVDCGEEAFKKCVSDIKAARSKIEAMRTMLGRN